MVSAFLNTVKIPELRRRILFTLAVIVIVRLGAAITTPGVNQAVLQEWFRTALDGKTGRQRRGAVQSVQWWRAGELRDLFVRHHALHQRVDHDAVADGGDSAARPAGARRWRPAEDHAVHALCDGGALHFPGISAGDFVPASGVVSHDACPESPTRSRELGIPLVEIPGWVFRIVTVISLTTGTMFLMWLGDQITERGIGNGISLDHYHRHRGALARGAGAGLEDFRAFGADRREPGQSGDSRLDGGVSCLS